MHFKNLNAWLTIVDNFELDQVTLKFEYKLKSTDLEELLNSSVFLSARRITTGSDTFVVSTNITLDSDGKEAIQLLIRRLKALDAQYLERSSLLDDFMSLVEE